MESNFTFLEKEFPILYEIGSIAEKYLFSDANSCLIKLGMFGETVVNLMMKLDGIPVPEMENTHANRIKLLKREGMLPDDIDDILQALRISRNKAVHENMDDGEKCKILLQMAYNLSVWFMQVYGDWDVKVPVFKMPMEDKKDYISLFKEQEKMIVQLSSQIEKMKVQNISQRERIKRAKKAVGWMDLSEEETRYLIDKQLRKVGWQADSQNLRYSKGTRPQKGKNLAIAEWPTDIKKGRIGHVDYALFIGLKMVGIIEAKRANKDVLSVIDLQAKEYAKTVQKQNVEDFLVMDPDSEYNIGPKNHIFISDWNGYRVPFIFVTNGRKYLEQLKTKSGIWFLDVRSNSNIPKPLKGWIRPEGITEWLEKDEEEANNRLSNTSYELLKDENGLGLRDYQINAIKAAENKVIEGQKRILISMATGTGKTRTILGMIYRFLKSNRFKRILFLVDRTALGIQAQDVFNEVKLEDSMSLNDIYNIKSLEDKNIDKETKIHIATVQSLIKRIFYHEEERVLSVSDYDLIIVDEAHRGYTLDKELNEDEFIYRNMDDFVSKYRAVIDYFDAVKIALTATPALHTTEIFGRPVYNYSYREAVIDGYLVDHNPPHSITTKLGTEGIRYRKGETIAIYDPITGEITNTEELEDELYFDIEQFNRKVITEEFNRAVLKEIANEINPDGEGKTLIYAVDDNHAELIVTLLREIYEEVGINQDAIMKITGKTGDKRRVAEAIRRFKNERYPNVVVTVDLLTTGIDVPEITTLVFMRRVKSRILFEQMLGRATRLCEKIKKTHFEIYDPIGVYESLQDVSTMKPVVTNPSTDFEYLLKGLELLPSEAQIRNQIGMIVAKMRRKVKMLTEEQNEYFEVLTEGKNVGEFLEFISELSPQEAKNILIHHRQIFDLLRYNRTSAQRGLIISKKEDEVITHTRGYGKGKKPQDYLQEFKEFITEHMDKIEALKLVCTRPSGLTRKSLKDLKITLDQHGFTENQLNHAWKELKNEEIAADIISFIRSQSIGSVMISHEDRIKNAIKKLKRAHNFSKMELDWLDRIEKNLLTENILSEKIFDTGIFLDKGGFKKIDRIFKNRLKDYIIELNQYLYDDGGDVA